MLCGTFFDIFHYFSCFFKYVAKHSVFQPFSTLLVQLFRWNFFLFLPYRRSRRFSSVVGVIRLLPILLLSLFFPLYNLISILNFLGQTSFQRSAVLMAHNSIKHNSLSMNRWSIHFVLRTAAMNGLFPLFGTRW